MLQKLKFADPSIPLVKHQYHIPIILFEFDVKVIIFYRLHKIVAETGVPLSVTKSFTFNRSVTTRENQIFLKFFEKYKSTEERIYAQ